MMIKGLYSVQEDRSINLDVELIDSRLSLDSKCYQELAQESETFSELRWKGSYIPLIYWQFCGFLNALFPNGAWKEHEIDELQLLTVAKKMRCQKLIDQATKDICDKVSSFQVADVNKAAHYYLKLKDEKHLGVVADAYTHYFGKVFLEKRGKDEIDALIDLYNELEISDVVLDGLDQDQLIGLKNWVSLRSLIIKVNNIVRIHSLPKNLRYLRMDKGHYLSSKGDHEYPPSLESLKIDQGLWLGDKFVKSIPAKVSLISLCASDITDVGLSSFSNNLTSLTLICIEVFNDQSMKLMSQNLVHLEVRSTGLTLTKEGFKAVPRKVSSLMLSGKMPEINREALSHLPPDLEILELSGCSNLKSDELDAVSNVRQLILAEMPTIRTPITFMKQLEYLKVWRLIEFSKIRMFPDTLSCLELSESALSLEDVYLMPEKMDKLILRRCWIIGDQNKMIEFEILDKEKINKLRSQALRLGPWMHHLGNIR